MSARRNVAVICAAAFAMPFVLATGIALAAAGSGAISQADALSVPACHGTISAARPEAGLDGSQIANAQIIYNVATGMNLPQRAAAIAIATAMQESRLENIGYGTSDSLGLFQQRPSQGWGTPAQIMNPVYAATAFYRALVQVPNWQSLLLAVAAQDVQHSADPGAYAQWEPLAGALADEFAAATKPCQPTGDNPGVPQAGTTHLPAGFALPPGTPQQVQVAISFALAQLGKPYIWGGTGPSGYDCSGLVMMAYRAAGIDLPRTTYQQVDAGTPVYSISQLKPGDLLFTAGSDGTASHPGHVGILIASGLVISAPQTGEPVMITPMSGYWQQDTVAIRRIVLRRVTTVFPFVTVGMIINGLRGRRAGHLAVREGGESARTTAPASPPYPAARAGHPAAFRPNGTGHQAGRPPRQADPPGRRPVPGTGRVARSSEPFGIADTGPVDQRYPRLQRVADLGVSRDWPIKGHILRFVAGSSVGAAS